MIDWLLQYPAAFVTHVIDALKYAFSLFDQYVISSFGGDLPAVFSFIEDFPTWGKITALIVAALLYLGIGVVLFIFVGKLVNMLRVHVGSHGGKLFSTTFAVWSLICFVITGQLSWWDPGLSPDITRWVVIGGWALYFLFTALKVKWRVVYFPIISLLIYVMILAGIVVAIVPLLIVVVLSFFFGGSGGSGDATIYTCDSCRKQYYQSGTCPGCGGWVS